ncbi:MAG TPA: aldo/keto reductase [Ramlibacter sp.]|nr:aldo/keto reductase [Ramlibacter sp.]
MSLDTYYTLGRSGLRVSRLALGTMNFGTEWGWGCDSRAARAIFDAYVGAGGNFIDTADVYTNGTSEQWLGGFIADAGCRDRLVLSTKFTKNMDQGDPNAGGNGRKNILRAVDASLRRLRTDYIDLYVLHQWDVLTPVEEVIRTLDDLVRAGKVRYVGLSDVPAWYAAVAQTLAEERGLERVCSLQMQYSLLERNVEHEFVPLCLAKGMSLTAWSPLGGGLLTGKYRRTGSGIEGAGRLDVMQAQSRAAKRPMSGRSSALEPLAQLNDRSFAILAELESVAQEIGRPVAEVALQWVASRAAVGALIIGASSVAQLESNIRSLHCAIPEPLLASLDAVSRQEPPFPYYFFGGDWQRRIRGGRAVWSKPPGYFDDGLEAAGNPRAA